MNKPQHGPYRATHGLIDPNSRIDFTFNDQRLQAHKGDTLASALLANGQRLLARSFKYHRPRGLFSAGSEEPNALVTLAPGSPHQEPNTRATMVELRHGLVARSQNHRGPLGFDWMAVNDHLSAFLAAGFYYKTFMWPKSFWERVYEPVIRSAAGLGELSPVAEPDICDKGFLHTDLLIIGAGPAGLAAALTAGRAGMRVLVVEEDFLPGGRLNSENLEVDGQPGSVWAAKAFAELKALSTVRYLSRTCVYGAFDHGVYGAVQRCTDHLPETEGARARYLLWRIYARQCLLASGATERSIAFGNNDRPGIMLAGAVRSYLNRFGVAAGRQIAIFTNNDDGWRTAADLQAAGVALAAVIDTRDGPAPITLSATRTISNGRIIDTHGRLGLKAIRLADGQTITCDCLAVSGGWNPNLQLASHRGLRPRWHDAIEAFVPAKTLPEGMQVIGAASGSLSLSAALQQGRQLAQSVLDRAGIAPVADQAPRASDESTRISAFWHVRPMQKRRSPRAWVDLQNDVTTKDIALAYQEGFRSVEHLKRYTTLGMATDQGKTSNVLGLAILAEQSAQSIEQTGTTTFRPPVSPVPISALAGRSRGKHFRPTRRTPSHSWAEDLGAQFIESGNWLRAQWFSQPGENHWRDTVDREVRQTRSGVGICDVTTLGKIDIQGRHAAAFLDRVYANTFSNLAVGRVRYGLMLREDGFVMDDGTTARVDDNHYLMTTTTANAVRVFRHLEFCRQCLWPDMDVHLISVTEQWAQVAIAGPRSRELLQRVVDAPFDLSNDAFPFMACAELSVFNGTQARLFRISFSGELAYELAVPARYGNSLMHALMQVGEDLGVVAYGLEALGVMRVEKGHAAGNEINGQTTAANLGLGRMVSRRKDSIGSVLCQRDAFVSKDQLCLVGFMAEDRNQSLNAGAHFLADGAEETLANDEGWMSSVAWSPTLDRSIGLGFLRQGTARMGERVIACDPLRGGRIPVTVTSAHFVDPEGERLRA